MKTKIFFSVFLLIIVLNSCVSEFNAELPSKDIQILIVDGSIIENTDVTFYLSKSFPLNSIYRPEESLNIYATLNIIGSNGYISPEAIPLGRGAYRFSIGELEDGVSYGVQIQYEGNTYRSELTKPFRTPEIDSVSWMQPEEKGDVYFYVSTHDDSGETKFFLWNYTEDWEVTAYYYTTFLFNPDLNSFYFVDYPPYYYCWRKSESDKFIIGSTESLSQSRIINKELYSQVSGDSRFTNLYAVNITQKAISKKAFEYYQNKIVLNDEMGGIFTPQPAELSGNITCITDPSKKVMGYVEAVKNTVQKRIFVNAYQVTRPQHFNNCESITDDSLRALLRETNNDYVYAYKMLNYRPTEASPDNMPIEWATNTCTDCTAVGASKTKPDFWPNSHQ